MADEDSPCLAVTLFDRVKTFQQVLDRVKDRPVYEVGKEDVSVPDMIQFLGKLLKQKRKHPISATSLFEKQRSRRAMICLFLAILELVKRQALVLTQLDAFGDTGLEASAQGVEEAFNSGDSMSAIEQQYN